MLMPKIGTKICRHIDLNDENKICTIISLQITIEYIYYFVVDNI